jgi:holo-[acyl-carrier protein] synthase
MKEPMEPLMKPGQSGGIGIDVIEIDRVRRTLNRWGDRFLLRVFTDGEIAYCARRHDPSPSLAARFAAKEAFAKAVPAGVDPRWREVEVVLGDGNKPTLRLSPRLSDLLGDCRVMVSLSHTQEMAMATVLIT